MNNTHKLSSSIMMTTNYDQFRLHKNNRDIAPQTVKRLMKSIQQKDLTAINPIIINDKHEIIDGQHRFEACKLLKLPIFYTKNQTPMSDEAIILLNANQRSWAGTDYIHYWAKKGKQPYIDAIECAKICGVALTSTPDIICNTRHTINDLKKGTLSYGKIHWEVIAKTILEFQEIFPYARKTHFIRALTFLMKKGYYNHKKMFDKFRTNRYKLMKCADTEQYIMMFEDILNWHVPTLNKVSFTESATARVSSIR